MSEKTYGHIQVEIKNLSLTYGLLMNKLDPEGLKKKGRMKTEREPSPEEQAKRSRYLTKVNGKEQLCVPALNVYSCIVGAARNWKFGNKTFAPLVAGTIGIEPEDISLNTNKYEVDVRPITLHGIGGGKKLKGRAHVKPPWKLAFTIIYHRKFVNNKMIEVLKDVIEDAGIRKGLLDFRPEHMGPFGTYELAKFEIED